MKSSKHSIKTWPAICTVILMTAASTANSAGESEDEAHAGRVLAASCAACHGTQGRANDAMPILAGMPKDLLIKRMKAFKSGEREATVMHQLAKGYSNKQIKLLADYFVNQKQE